MKRPLKRCVRSLETLEARQLLAGDLVAHWVAGDLEVAVADQAPVQAWTDRVAQIPASGSGMPVLATNQLGGRAVVRFDAADGEDYFRIDRGDNPLALANDFSVFVVFATSSPGVGGDGDWFQNTGLIDSNGQNLTEGWGISLNSAGQIAAGMEDGLGSVAKSVVSAESGLNDGQVHVAAFTRSAGTMAISIDGGPAVTRNDGSVKPRGREAVVIGRLLNGATNPYSGDIAEIRFYDGSLDAAEVATTVGEILDHYSNSAPVANDDVLTTAEDNAFFLVPAPGVLANDTDADGDALTAVLVEATRHGSLSLRDDGSVFYSPDPNFNGTDTFTYRAVDFRESEAAATVTIEVTPVDDPTVGVADSYKAVPSQAISIEAARGVLANDINVDGDVLHARLATDVSAGQLQLNEDGSFVYDPQGFSGTATFTYQVDDGTRLSNPVAVSLIVNTPPAPAIDTYMVDEDTTLSPTAATGLLANDADADGNALMAVLDTLPTNGQLTFRPDGTFDYTPDENFFGVDLFSYRVTDGVDESDAALVQVTVRSVNDPPTTGEDGFFALPGRTVEVTAEFGVLRNDTDVESGTVTVAELVTPPAQGTLDFRADGSFAYTPNEGFAGEDVFTYRASDGQDFSTPTRVVLNVTDQPIVINEVMASNASTLSTMLRQVATDEFVGEVFTPDWFEIRNLLSQPIDIGGLHATDDPGNLTKWRFPAGTIVPGNGYLVVFASGLDLRDPELDQIGSLHTNFQLSTDGDYLAITTIDGAVVHSLGDELPTLRTHITYGLNDDRSGAGYFLSPTPGAANGPALLTGLVSDTRFDVDRGFFNEPFQLTISSDTPDAVIRYTSDGSLPDESSPLYEGPLTIDRTSTIRARAFKDQMVPTNTDTHSYFFLNDVVHQDAQQTLDAGFPDRWRSDSPDYGLSEDNELPEIAGDENMSVDQAREVIAESLRSLPTLSITMNVDDLFGEAGIYANPSRSGKDWERATSVELIHPDGEEGFQIDSGIRIQGGAFRGFGLTKKKSFRLLFKTEYGPGKLNYPMFGADAVDEFDTLTLRMESNDGWQWSGAGAQPVYARDEFHRRTQLAMGQPAPHGRNVHLYLNGFYWGMYNVVERPDESFGEAYFGSEAYDWDGQNSGTAINSEDDRYRASRGRDAWRALTDLTNDIRAAETEAERTALFMRTLGRNPDGTENPDYETWIDAVNYSDYLIANYYGGNADWPFKNYYFGRENSPDSEGFKFFLWDAEWSLFLRSNRGTGLINDFRGVATPWRGLRESAEFRLLFADRVQKHFFNGGALYVDPENPNWDPEHPERNQPAARWVEFTNEIYGGLIGESARWGDQHNSRSPYTRDRHWARENQHIIDDWFPERTFELLEIFRNLDLYPSTAAAMFSQRGGVVTDDQDITLTAPAGTIYYTTDGSDPRLIGGAVSPSARAYNDAFRLSESATVRVRVLNGEDWSALDEAEFLVGRVPASSENFRISEVNYNPGELQPGEIAAGVDDKDEFEYIEFVNISSETLDLTNVQLVQTVSGADRLGVAFDFADAAKSSLAPGERVLVVENAAAFAVRYGDALTTTIAGQWSGGLSNNAETITVTAGDEVLQAMTYRDEWHPVTDGGGATLEIIDATDSDLTRWSSAAAWRPSAPGGSPGTAGDGRVVGDSNGDGIFNSSDLVAVFQAGEYEDAIPGNSTFEEGDWNGDGDFTTADLVWAFQRGNYLADNNARAKNLERQSSAATEQQRRNAIDALMSRVDERELVDVPIDQVDGGASAVLR